ncbi:hypothetical protein LCGC14_0718130 [marine sediment metagenome]|uniref:BppU N-terminal domain-containing protein n=1 Tax=marine sediment metagenome TaxID=412755 RepID=A0A0F9SYJ7_9ZZZZ
MANIDPISIDQGSTFEKSWIFRNADLSFFDFTGYIIRAQLRSEHNANLAANFGAEFSDPTNGQFKIALTATGSAGLAAGNYVYDVKIDNLSGSILRLVEGPVELRPEVTK